MKSVGEAMAIGHAFKDILKYRPNRRALSWNGSFNRREHKELKEGSAASLFRIFALSAFSAVIPSAVSSLGISHSGQAHEIGQTFAQLLGHQVAQVYTISPHPWNNAARLQYSGSTH